MTCSDSNLKQIQQTIIDCTKKNKLEYTEFYILDLPYDTIKNIPDKDILFALLFKIDQHRMSLNLSTVTVKQKYNIIDDKFSYFPDESREKFIDYKLNISENEVCIFLKK
ncbi:hypothetical protein [Flavobacterium sp. CECT 9288]|uniref:hypothetical protein n=1 Tax=Flavobacterium sp. CECT 9288 TaxID=2845819 RepID=UPI001E3962A4|nr:hypothetical protein [Flavobacterium sp. CECT 9288]